MSLAASAVTLDLPTPGAPRKIGVTPTVIAVFRTCGISLVSIIAVVLLSYRLVGFTRAGHGVPHKAPRLSFTLWVSLALG